LADQAAKFAGVCRSFKAVCKVDKLTLKTPSLLILTVDALILESSLVSGLFSTSISWLTMLATSSELLVALVLDETAIFFSSAFRRAD
jgi:hypothetical protein